MSGPSFFSNIKLSSPLINNIIIIGSIVIYAGVFISSLDYGRLLPSEMDNHVCMVCITTQYSCLPYKGDMRWIPIYISALEFIVCIKLKTYIFLCFMSLRDFVIFAYGGIILIALILNLLVHI